MFRGLGEEARDTDWPHEEYLDAVLSKEIFERESSGDRLRIKAARFRKYKALDDSKFDYQLSAVPYFAEIIRG